MGERRVAGTEVVDGELDADVLDLPQQGQRVPVVVQGHRLGDLQDELVRGQAAFGQHLQDHARQVRVGQLHRRDVDTDLHRYRRAVVPPGGLVAGPGEYPRADRDDQSAVLGEGDELQWRQGAALRMVPAQQRLETDGRPAGQLDDRLVPQG